MRIRLFATALLVSILSIVNLSASNKNEAFEKEQVRKKVIIEEVIYQEGINNLMKKIVFERDANNNQELSRYMYIKEPNQGWIPYRKYQFSYPSADATTPSSLTYTQWNNVVKSWDRAQQFNL